MQVLRANKSTSRYAIYFQPHHRCLRVLISGYLKKELEEPFLSATLCTLPPPPSTSVLHGHLCFKLKLFYVNRSPGLAGTVVNCRWTPELKRKAFHSIPALHCLAQCGEIFPFFKKNQKFGFYVTSLTFKYWQLITLKVCKTAPCQPNKMLLWKDISKGYQCGRVGRGLPTPPMLSTTSQLPSTKSILMVPWDRSCLLLNKTAPN